MFRAEASGSKKSSAGVSMDEEEESRDGPPVSQPVQLDHSNLWWDTTCRLQYSCRERSKGLKWFEVMTFANVTFHLGGLAGHTIDHCLHI